MFRFMLLFNSFLYFILPLKKNKVTLIKIKAQIVAFHHICFFLKKITYHSTAVRCEGPETLKISVAENIVPLLSHFFVSIIIICVLEKVKNPAFCECRESQTQSSFKNSSSH